MNDRIRTLVAAFTGGLVVLALGTAASALAETTVPVDAVPRQIPYSGTIEKDGVGLSDDVTLRFSLYDAPDAAANLLWTQDLKVPVYAGHFTAVLGSLDDAKAAALTTTVTSAKELYLGIDIVLDKEKDTLVKLSNRQRFLPAPYALWTTAATNFTVASGLTVGGPAEVGSLHVLANAKVDGAFSSAKMSCRATCKDLKSLTLPGSLTFGSYDPKDTYCPPNYYVCGMNQKVEKYGGSSVDDTGVTGVRIICCPF